MISRHGLNQRKTVEFDLEKEIRKRNFLKGSDFKELKSRKIKSKPNKLEQIFLEIFEKSKKIFLGVPAVPGDFPNDGNVKSG